MLSALATATAATRSLMGLTSEENVEQVEASGGDDLTANAVEKGLCPKRLERITTWLDKQAAENKVAGCSAAVIRGGKVVVAREVRLTCRSSATCIAVACVTLQRRNRCKMTLLCACIQ